MKKCWGFLKKTIVMPEEFTKITDVDFQWLDQQTKIVETIARFINVNRYKLATSEFTIEPVSGTKRFRQMVEKFGDDNLEIERSVVNIDDKTRKMDVRYRLLLPYCGRIYRITVVVYILARFTDKTVSRFDNQLQEICNIQVMSYLKMHYPFLWKVFGKCIETPILQDITEKFEQRIKEKLKYYHEPTPYKLEGATLVCVHQESHYIPDYEKRTVGDLIGLTKNEMTSVI